MSRHHGLSSFNPPLGTNPAVQSSALTCSWCSQIAWWRDKLRGGVALAACEAHRDRLVAEIRRLRLDGPEGLDD